MNKKCGEFNKGYKHSERGEGGIKLIIFLVGLFLAIWAGYNSIPIFYNLQSYKQEMDTTMTQAVTLPNAIQNPVGWSSERLKRMGPDYGVPEDAVIEVKQLQNNSGVQAQVKFKKPISLLPFYTYEYEFDYTTKTGGFMNK